MWEDLRSAQPTLPDHGWGGSANGTSPATGMTWFEAVLFANLLSIQQGFDPSYYTDATMATAIDVSNYEAGLVFCDFDADGFRLPTEGEWESFCRAGTLSPFWIIDPNYNSTNCVEDIPDLAYLDGVAWYSGNNIDVTWVKPVAGKTSNPWGLHDVHGNAGEWCWDWYDPVYPLESATYYTGPENGTQRVYRGGMYHMHAVWCRSAARLSYNPASSHVGIGFRLCRTETTK
jgi:formylglycine-generating enzyme required for sulfatase activity